MASPFEKLGLEPKDWVTAIAVIASLALNWGVVSTRVGALEEAVKPIPQLHTDIEVVKAALVDIRDDLRQFSHARRATP